MTANSNYLVEVAPARPESGSTPSAGPVYRHVAGKDNFPTIEVNTLYELFLRSSTKYANEKCLGHRPKLANGEVGAFEFKTYKQVADEVSRVASGLASLGIIKDSRVGVFGANCPEWMIAMQVGVRLIQKMGTASFTCGQRHRGLRRSCLLRDSI